MKTFNTEQEANDYSNNNPTETVEYKSYYYGGKLHEHLFYVNGKPHGELKSYHSNGQLRHHCFYVDGSLHGEYKMYLDDGRLYEHIFYADGVRNADLDHLAKDNRTPEETELVKSAVGDNYFK